MRDDAQCGHCSSGAGASLGRSWPAGQEPGLSPSLCVCVCSLQVRSQVQLLSLTWWFLPERGNGRLPCEGFYSLLNQAAGKMNLPGTRELSVGPNHSYLPRMFLAQIQSKLMGLFSPPPWGAGAGLH